MFLTEAVKINLSSIPTQMGTGGSGYSSEYQIGFDLHSIVHKSRVNQSESFQASL